MNAYELAEKVRETYELYIPKESKYFWIMDATVMLRQQADRINELEVTKFHLEGDINRLEDQVNELLVAKHFKDMGRTK